MAHGGIRYFEQMMFLRGDHVESYNLLKETLTERDYFMFSAPFLNKKLELCIPQSSLAMSAFFYYPGALMYHLMYMKASMKSDFNE